MLLCRYGSRVPTEHCGLAVVAMSAQSIVGVVIQACMAGIVFAKFTKPTNRAETILFSKGLSDIAGGRI